MAVTSGVRPKSFPPTSHSWRATSPICASPPAAAKTSRKAVFFSSLLTPEQALDATRSHWQIENGLHWTLDVHFDEDLSRARKENAPANTAILDRIAKNILQIADPPKVPISHRIKKCAWNDEYLINALSHMR
ncbi:hypothetical protein [Mesorhizobium sp. M0118]|uniref:hypothetical protein n=1 Tax=Mesorhizobium sp. M0118 TaxID=2956884 RepID=UPI003339BF0A